MEPPQIALIPAAGLGSRLYPATGLIPKCLIEIDGTSLIERNVKLIRDSCAIRRFVVVTAHLGEMIQRQLGDGSALGVEINYVRNDQPQNGLGYSVACGLRAIEGSVFVILADEFYQSTNHTALITSRISDYQLMVASISTKDQSRIRRNYAVYTKRSRVTRLEEKPLSPTGAKLGTGTILLGEALVERIRRDYADHTRQKIHLICYLNEQVGTGMAAGDFSLCGDYVNVNEMDSLHCARKLASKYSSVAPADSQV